MERKIPFDLGIKRCVFLVLGAAILAFGLFNVHSFAQVTEGGTLGLTLLLSHHFGISPAISSALLNAVCYLIGFRTLGVAFIVYSAIATASFSGFYALFEFIGPVWPDIADHRLFAAVIGALFVGIGVGLCVRAGGAPCGDDALAMSLSSIFKVGIRTVYLVSDLSVLLLSLTYINPIDILYSLLTVILSGQIIGFVERVGRKKERHPEEKASTG